MIDLLYKIKKKQPRKTAFDQVNCI